MELQKKIKVLEFLIKDPKKGLGEEIFLFVSRITPLINVDLLIKNEKGQTLLTWRDDIYYSRCWHVPGGIVRYKERITDRIKKVAKNELGVPIEFKKEPIAIKELIHPTRKNRGHFISLLYECKLITPLPKKLMYKKGVPKAGQWAWHNKCPRNIIHCQRVYKKFM